jgi:hypothetical protein
MEAGRLDLIWEAYGEKNEWLGKGKARSRGWWRDGVKELHAEGIACAKALKWEV